MAKKKSFNILLSFLYLLLAFLFVGLPIIWTFKDGDFTGLAFPMAAVGLWLLLFGRIKIGGLRIEGKQALTVGSSLLVPLFITGAVNNLNLWPALAIGAILAGLISAVVLYFVIPPTTAPQDRSLALILLVSGIVLILIGSAIGKPADSAGVVLVEGVSILPISSMQVFLQGTGIMVVLAGLFGLIFGFNKKK
ncbi:MAG: hypothetical protein WBB69_03060 [Anaerolineales bacterium]